MFVMVWMFIVQTKQTLHKTNPAVIMLTGTAAVNRKPQSVVLVQQLAILSTALQLVLAQLKTALW